MGSKQCSGVLLQAWSVRRESLESLHCLGEALQVSLNPNTTIAIAVDRMTQFLHDECSWAHSSLNHLQKQPASKQGVITSHCEDMDVSCRALRLTNAPAEKSRKEQACRDALVSELGWPQQCTWLQAGAFPSAGGSRARGAPGQPSAGRLSGTHGLAALPAAQAAGGCRPAASCMLPATFRHLHGKGAAHGA